MVTLRIKNIQGNINIKKDEWDKFAIISQFIIGLLMVALTAFIAFKSLPDIKEDIKNISSINIQQSLPISTSVDVLATLYRNISIINFDIPNEIIKDKTFNTKCYIENNQGDSIYVINELNFTSPRLKLNERYEFLCEIRNGEVYKIF